MSCGYKSDHVKVQVPDEDWKCPDCGAKHGDGWEIEECVDWGCSLLHNSDEIACSNCGFSITGQGYSEWYAKRSKKVMCPCCNGAGVVDRDGSKNDG